MAKKKSTVLRELIERPEIAFRLNVAIALEARMAEAAGFETVSISGYHTSAHLLGLPDAGYITQADVVENTRRICNAVDIPVMADCDTGFGNAINARRTVQLIIQAGAAGLFIEDQVSPPRCGMIKGIELIPIEEAVGKYRAVLDARDELDKDFIIMARTDARHAVGGSMEEVIRRCKAYREAGVDILYVSALKSREEIKQVRASVDGPLACTVGLLDPYPDLQEQQDMGLCFTLGVFYFEVGYAAWWDLLVDMKKRGLTPWIEWLKKSKDRPMTGSFINDLVGFPKVREWEEKYLPKEYLEKYDKSEGVYDLSSSAKT